MTRNALREEEIDLPGGKHVDLVRVSQELTVFLPHIVLPGPLIGNDVGFAKELEEGDELQGSMFPEGMHDAVLTVFCEDFPSHSKKIVEEMPSLMYDQLMGKVVDQVFVL